MRQQLRISLILLCVFSGLSSTSFAQTLDSVLAVQPIKVQARYSARHPKETLEFFGVKPGMTVIEALPGGGWYSNILVPLLGSDGQLIGADYAFDMYPKFKFYGAEYLAAKKTWAKTWTNETAARHGDSGAQIDAFPFGSMSADVEGKVDLVVLIRALHNLARFENDGGYLSIALKEIFRALKPGGALGVVQHMAPESGSAEWTNGSNGYLKKSFVLETMKKAGFEFVADSDININPADQPEEGDMVWRLPPTLMGGRDGIEQLKKLEAIGETTRMTLLFRKPA